MAESRDYRILLGVPSGGTLCEESAHASFVASLRYEVKRVPGCLSAPNHNDLWCDALNAGLAGEYTHYAAMHADLKVIESEPGLAWADRLIEEMDAGGYDFVSAAVAIKDRRGLTSCGLGDPADPWKPWRRFTVKELARMPRTFAAADVGHGDKYLLHNHALCVWDLRRPLWYEPDAAGRCRVLFNFREEIRLEGGRWVRHEQSDDWFFSRRLWQAGARTAVTRRVRVLHKGFAYFDSQGSWGQWDEDEATRDKWGADALAEMKKKIKDVGDVPVGRFYRPDGVEVQVREEGTPDAL